MTGSKDSKFAGLSKSSGSNVLDGEYGDCIDLFQSECVPGPGIVVSTGSTGGASASTDWLDPLFLLSLCGSVLVPSGVVFVNTKESVHG